MKLRIEQRSAFYSSVAIAMAIIIALLDALTFTHYLWGELPRSVVYIAEIIAFGIGIFFNPNLKIDRLLCAFCIVAAISLAINNPAPTYRSSERLLFFVIMLALLSPLVSNEWLQLLRQKLWITMVWGLRAVVIVSAVLYPIWLFDIGESHKAYAGVTVQAMRFGILAAFVFVETLYRLTNISATTKAKIAKVVLYLLLLIVSFIMMMVSGSRSVMLGGIIGAIPMIVIIAKKCTKRTLIVALVSTIAVGGIIVSTQAFSRTILYKFNVAIEHNSLTYSRDELWQARWNEFKESPIIGIGFSNSTHYSERWDGNFQERGVISEPGSSWLAILSNTGLVGFLIFAWFNVRLLRRLYQKPFEAQEALFLGVWLLLIVHGFFEGWVIYAGNTSFLLYWLLTSKIINNSNIYGYKAS